MIKEHKKYSVWNQGSFYAVIDNTKDVIVAVYITKEEAEEYIKGGVK